MSRSLVLLMAALVLLTGLSACSAAGRGPLLVAPFEVTGKNVRVILDRQPGGQRLRAIDAEHGQAATAVLVMYLREAGVDVRDWPASAPPPTTHAEMRQAAFAAGERWFLRGHLTTIGDKTITVSVELFDANYTVTMPGGEVPKRVWDADVAAGNTPEDLETCLGDLAQSLATWLAVKYNPDILAQEAKLRRRRDDYYHDYLFGVKIGGFSPVTGDDTDISPQFGFVWTLDTRNLFFDVAGEFYGVGSGVDGLGLSLGVNYAFLDTDFSPFLGGGLGLAGMETVRRDESDDGPSGTQGGLTGFVGLGAIAGRTRRVAVRADVRYMITMIDAGSSKLQGFVWTLGLNF